MACIDISGPRGMVAVVQSRPYPSAKVEDDDDDNNKGILSSDWIDKMNEKYPRQYPSRKLDNNDADTRVPTLVEPVYFPVKQEELRGGLRSPKQKKTIKSDYSVDQFIEHTCTRECTNGKYIEQAHFYLMYRYWMDENFHGDDRRVCFREFRDYLHHNFGSDLFWLRANKAPVIVGVVCSLQNEDSLLPTFPSSDAASLRRQAGKRVLPRGMMEEDPEWKPNQQRAKRPKTATME